MAYTKTIWENLPSTNTPINQTNLNKIENQLKASDMPFKFLGDASSDFNNARTFGVYKVAGIYTNAPLSTSIFGILLVYESNGETWTPTESQSGGSWIWQEFRDTNGNIYRRNAVNYSNDWSNWIKVSTENISWEQDLTLNTTYFQADSLKYFKVGNVVTFKIDELVANQDVTQNATVILSGLPHPVSNEVFQLNRYAAADYPNSRVMITTSGDMILHYDTIFQGSQYYGEITYLT